MASVFGEASSSVCVPSVGSSTSEFGQQDQSLPDNTEASPAQIDAELQESLNCYEARFFPSCDTDCDHVALASLQTDIHKDNVDLMPPVNLRNETTADIKAASLLANYIRKARTAVQKLADDAAKSAEKENSITCTSSLFCSAAPFASREAAGDNLRPAMLPSHSAQSEHELLLQQKQMEFERLYDEYAREGAPVGSRAAPGACLPGGFEHAEPGFYK